ncbi:Small nuclear ribonucleoprotein 27kDa (U4 U6.U5) [Seminavis robusta]|uniref:Small nuclear ribonucleoprotein 27kDa (U4 U6.U5) n=1 Tax=Seminavis robusta TaxID=568900 RepID=A0A9N8HJW9_9STRA|nr:Small nuclear ribonucleoprotein 27kDa (U4 U6.U5) [Seminavis robusta]|eukprot:Sro795_g203550.1 Small nuclear ribonucleoprotein 27kDa (U4 U6.U5) (209) ;mRNA; f:31343-32078
MSESRWGPRNHGSDRRRRGDDHRGGGDWRRDRSRSRSPSPPSIGRRWDREDRRRGDEDRRRNEKDEAAPPVARVSSSDRDRQEADRKARMARLRMENEEEERRLANVDGEGDEDGNDGTNHNGRKRRRPEPTKEIIQVQESELEGLDEEEQMKRLLGFSGGFGSTSGQQVEDNQSSAAQGAAAKNKARKYRQYMNRKNGFNRPLEKME